MATPRCRAVAAALALSLCLPFGSPAQVPPAAPATNASPAAADAELAHAQVRKVDREAGKLTLKHGEIKRLDMPPMTMVFGVRDAKLLDGLKPGDKVRFLAVDEGGGKLVVVELRPAP